MSPGDSLSRIIEARKISKQALAKELDIDMLKLENILQGHTGIDLEIAQALEIILGFRASFWLLLQQAWNDERNKRNLL